MIDPLLTVSKRGKLNWSTSHRLMNVYPCASLDGTCGAVWHAKPGFPMSRVSSHMTRVRRELIVSILLIVKDNIEEGTVHVQPAIIVNKAELAEPIHEETDA